MAALRHDRPLQGTCLLALGHHTLKDVMDLCTCTCDDVMKALEESRNPRSVPLYTSFYLFDSHGIIDMSSSRVCSTLTTTMRWFSKILKPSGISPLCYCTQLLSLCRDFCRVHGSGWPLDVSPSASCDFRVGSLSTPLKHIPLRASNKPLYLYAHRGGCEHLVHVRNVRLPHARDDSALQIGPIRTRTTHVTVRKCSICEKTVSALLSNLSPMLRQCNVWRWI